MRGIFNGGKEMQQGYEARRELERELANYKQAYRRNSLPRDIARYLAREIHALEQLLKER